MTSTKTPGRPVEFTADRKRLAVDAFRRTAKPTEAAKAAGVSLSTIQRHRIKDPAFEEAWGEAVQFLVEEVEAAVRELALVGQLKTTYGKNGEVVSEEHKRSLGAMTLFLKAWAPLRYRENISLGVSGGTTVDVSHRIDPSTMTHEQRVAMRLLLRPEVEVTIGEEVSQDGN